MKDEVKDFDCLEFHCEDCCWFDNCMDVDYVQNEDCDFCRPCEKYDPLDFGKCEEIASQEYKTFLSEYMSDWYEYANEYD